MVAISAMGRLQPAPAAAYRHLKTPHHGRSRVSGVSFHTVASSYIGEAR